MKLSAAKFIYIFSLSIFIFGCKPSNSKIISSNSTEYVNYITSYTSGHVGRTENIYVNFAEVITADLDAAIEPKVLSFSPKIKGTYRWNTPSQLVFTPDEMLVPGVNYQATLTLGEVLSQVPSDLKTFKFGFSVPQLYGELSPPIQTIEHNGSFDLSGQLTLSDQLKIDPKDVAISLDLEPETYQADIVIIDETTVEYTFKNIPRADVDKTGVISTSIHTKYAPADIATQEVLIPAKNAFKVISTDLVDYQGEPVIRVTFSDILADKQSFKGLVTLNGSSNHLDYMVSRNILYVLYTVSSVQSGNLKISSNIQSASGEKIGTETSKNIDLATHKPSVRLVSNGQIIPSQSGKALFPFEAIGLHTVDVEIMKIYTNNTFNFLRNEEIDYCNNLSHVGDIIHQQKVVLSALNPATSSDSWTRYALNIASLIDLDPNAIYRVTIFFRPSYVIAQCDPKLALKPEQPILYHDVKIPIPYEGVPSLVEHDAVYKTLDNQNDIDWENDDDPCKPEFYYYDYQIKVSSTIVVSDVGLAAKVNKNGQALIVVTDLHSANPIEGATIECYSNQNQKIYTGNTGPNGLLTVALKQQPRFIVASYGGSTTYLSISDASSLSMSKFDVDGRSRNSTGMQAFLYGERGVWRPGDTIFLNAILRNELNNLPDKYPVTLELYNARNALVYTNTTGQHLQGLYNFVIPTLDAAETGYWRAILKYGAQKLSKTLVVETIKPNRLKINLGLPESIIKKELINQPIDGQVDWLFGTPANNISVKIESQIQPRKTTFKTAKDYYFEAEYDKSKLNSQIKPINVRTDENGHFSYNLTKVIPPSSQIKGMVNLSLTTTATEPSDDFSIDNMTIPYSPYTSYAGQSAGTAWGRLNIDKENPIQLIVVNAEGNPLPSHNIEVTIARLDWQWWWDGNNGRYRYQFYKERDNIISKKFTTNASGLANWSFKPEEWGRYLIEVKDLQSGHQSQKAYYAGYPYGDVDQSAKEALAMLPIKTEKTTYNIGDKFNIQLPEAKSGRALVTIDNGHEMISTKWIELSKASETIEMTATEAMAPWIYVSVQIIQPHAQVENDLPIRLYGVVPVQIQNPDLTLNPSIQVASTWRPNQDVTIEVTEQNRREMAYSLAIVDDGLLDLTRFKTPDPYKSIFSKPALDIRTWDVYDEVLGAYSGDMDRILAVGGDEAVDPDRANKANRFPPVVIHTGTHLLKAGQTNTHKVHIPNYFGSVRVMLVATDEKALGHTDATVLVKQPLMVKATLPRVLAPGEEVSLPVTVFVTEDQIKSVELTVSESSGLADAQGTQRLNFSKSGEKVAYFTAKMGNKEGIAIFTVRAKGNGEQTSETIEIQVRNPNTTQVAATTMMLTDQSKEQLMYEPLGVQGTNTGLLEISKLKSLELQKHIDNLLQYPYGCLEQTVSSALPQLYLTQVMDLNTDEQSKVQHHIDVAINKLAKFASDDGRYMYWPGQSHYHEFSTSYAGMFLTEASHAGYPVSSVNFKRWKQGQRTLARQWRASTFKPKTASYYFVNQAYRLYTLALAGSPELGAMNELYAMDLHNSAPAADILVGLAYALAGNDKTASTIAKRVSASSILDYHDMRFTFGSRIRDWAYLLELYIRTNDEQSAMTLFNRLADQFNNSYTSTQDKAAVLRVYALMNDKWNASAPSKILYTMPNGVRQEATLTNKILRIPINNPEQKGTIHIQNPNASPVFSTIVRKGRPVIGAEESNAKNLKMSVQYMDMTYKPINIATLKQGTSFLAKVTVNSDYKGAPMISNMALSQVFPSGWEIVNSRMSAVTIDSMQVASVPTYQDIRDDRVYTYFDLKVGKSNTYYVRLTATYPGRYYLGAVTCEAMYSGDIYAHKKGQWVEVIAESN